MSPRLSRSTGFVPALDPASGGMFQYGLALLRALEQIDPDGSEHLMLLRGAQAERPRGPWPAARLETPAQTVSRHLSDLLRRDVPTVDRVKRRPRTAARLRRFGIEMMIFAAPDQMAVEIGIPFVMPVHDLQHRLQPQFPEVSEGGEWQRREYLYVNAARSRSVLITDSETGKEDALDCYGEYGLTADRVAVLPFQPSPTLDTSISYESARAVCGRLGAPDGFAFYPAQFWPHKGHLSLIRGLAVLNERGARLPLVLVGSKSGALRERTYEEVMNLAEELGVARDVHYLGYVTDDEMSALYRAAVALVMPTYFGPTNIPVVEAWAFGCPVVTSDIRGIREQASGAALLVDPDSAEQIADGIQRVASDEALRERLTTEGHERLHRYTSIDHVRLFAEIVRRSREQLVG